MTAPDWAVGHIVGGKYTVRAVLGRGARMRTYAALTEPNREVVLRAVGAEDAAELEAVAQKLGALAALPEVHVLRVVEVAKDAASGARFVVTDRSRSPSLASLVELCPLTLEEGIAFAGKLGAAVDVMHERGVLHLRLRPTNVFVGAMPAGTVEVADAGVPRLDESAAERARWTAPEARGGVGQDAAADVFTAALLVFFAITGKSYFKAESEQELLSEISGPRLAASKRASELGVTLPGSVDAAFDRALAADPRSRLRSVSELARMLGSPTAVASHVVAPPADLMASLIESELKESDIPVDEARVADASVLLASEPASSAPSLGVAPAKERRAPRRRVGLVVGVVGGAIVLLVVASAVAFGRKKTSLASVRAASVPVVSSASVAVVDSPSATGAASTDEAASSSASAASSASATALDPEHSELLVVCDPTCDLVMVDRKRMTAYPDPMMLAPGQHGVGVSAPDHWGDWKLVETRGGERATVTFKLRSKSDPLPNYVPPAASASVKKPCGKFLKRCD